MALIVIMFLIPIVVSIKIRLDEHPINNKKYRYRKQEGKRYSFNCRGYRDFYGEEM